MGYRCFLCHSFTFFLYLKILVQKDEKLQTVQFLCCAPAGSGGAWRLSVQDAGQPECPSTQDGLLWLTPVEGGKEVLTQAPREPFTVPVLPVTSPRDVCVCGGEWG